jgi:hypothetical protein
LASTSVSSGEIGVVDFDFVALVLLEAGEHFQAAPPAGADDRVVGIGDGLQFVQDETRDDDRPFQEPGVNQVGDASVNNNAGVQDEQVFGLALRGEADVGDDEGEILLVAAHGQDHADVAEADKQAKRMSWRWARAGSENSKSPEWSTNSAMTLPSIRPKVAAEKARREKPLSISSMAISSPPNPKPMTAPSQPPPIITGPHCVLLIRSGRN